MLKKSNVLIVFFIAKIILDFFFPERELNSLIQLCIVIPIMGNRKFIYFIISKRLILVIFYFLFYVLLSKNIQSIKIFSAVLLFYVFYFLGYKTNFTILLKRSKLIWRVGLLSFFASLVLSVVKGIYQQRKFFNFEHVNLLGTYFVFISIFYFLYYRYGNLQEVTKKIKKSSFVLIIASYLTLSTGAFLSQLSAFIPIKYCRLKSVFSLFTLLIIAGFSSYYITKSTSPELHQKMFGSINYFRKEISINKFYEDSIRQNLELNDSENSGSFTWRIFSYTFYLYKIFNQNLLNFLFGSGVESFFQFAEFAPHNDFIAIFLDFGLVGLFGFIYFLSQLFKTAIQKRFHILGTFTILVVLRLMFENVIYSSYVFTLITSIGGLLYGFALSVKLKK